jgi:hypothetical protein
MPRHASRIDVNQPEIVKAFRDLGYFWLHTHMYAGLGCDGILWLKTGKVAFIEIKVGTAKLTDSEERLRNICREHGVLFLVVTSVDDVLIIVDADRQELKGLGVRKRIE